MAGVGTPKFQIDEIVYIVASAGGRGFLESYRIDGMLYDKTSGKWVYQINVARAPGAGVIVGDHMQLQKVRILYFSEDELTDYCSALQLCETYLLRQLGEIQALISASNCSNT